MLELSAEQREILATVREFVDRDVIPTAPALEHGDVFPDALVQTMRELGLFGVTIREEYGGLGLDLTTYALIQVELSRGWMSLSGVLNSHFISAWMIDAVRHDAPEERYLRRWRRASARFAYSMTEPDAGSDVQAIRTAAVRDGDEYVIRGRKMWATNGLRAAAVMLLAKTDLYAEPPHRGMTAFCDRERAWRVRAAGARDSAEAHGSSGYKGVESTELVFDGFRTPAESVPGGEAGIGQGFKQFMAGIELGA